MKNKNTMLGILAGISVFFFGIYVAINFLLSGNTPDRYPVRWMIGLVMFAISELFIILHDEEMNNPEEKKEDIEFTARR